MTGKKRSAATLSFITRNGATKTYDAGSSTIYSTDIVGLKEYRTQSSDENEQKGFSERFAQEARNRISTLNRAYNEIARQNKNTADDVNNIDTARFRELLVDYQSKNTGAVTFMPYNA